MLKMKELEVKCVFVICFSLVQWLKYSRKEFCELCKHRFAFTPSKSSLWPRTGVLLIHTVTILFLFKLTVWQVFK